MRTLSAGVAACGRAEWQAQSAIAAATHVALMAAGRVHAIGYLPPLPAGRASMAPDSDARARKPNTCRPPSVPVPHHRAARLQAGRYFPLFDGASLGLRRR